MSQLNVFMSNYQPTEDKLTYNFLCLIEHMPNNKEFIEFITDGKFSLLQQKPVRLKGVHHRYKSNPDGRFSFSTHDGKNIDIYFENKTFRLGLTKEQILGHIREHCQDNNSFLLVVTPRLTDKSIIEDCIKDVGAKLFFKTWNQILEKLHEIEKSNPSFVVSQFIEYGKESGEFMNMQPTNDDINTYISYHSNNVENKMIHYLNSSTIDIDYSQFNDSIKRREKVDNHWGRLGYEYNFTNAYGMWFFYGIYFNMDNHKIKFKKDFEPEIAFFFDIGCDPDEKSPKAKQEQLKENRNKLKNNSRVKSIFDSFERQGFEENLFKKMTTNNWILLAHRTPLSEFVSEFGEFSVSNLESHLIERLKTVFLEEEFVGIITNS